MLVKKGIKSIDADQDVTNHQHVENKLKASEEKYKNLIEKMVNAFALHEMVYNEKGEAIDYRFLEINPAWERIVGLKSEDVIGKTLQEILPGIEDFWITTYERIVKTGVSEEFEQYSEERKQYFYCYAYKTEPGQFAVFFNDTTKQRLEEERIKENEKKYRGIFEQAAVGAARVNLDGSWLEVNGKLCELLGYSEEELLVKTFQNITHPEDLETDLHYLNQLINDEIKTYSMEKRYFTKSGETIWVNLTVSLVRKTDKEPDYFISIIEDIRSQKKFQERIKASEEKLRLLLNSLSVGVIVHAPDTSIIMNNIKATQLLGLNDKQRWKFLDESKNIMPLEEYPVNKIVSNKKQITNMVAGIVHSDKTDVIWVLVNGFPIFNDQNEIQEVIISFIDITELKYKDEMLIDQSRNAAMGEMISMIAHQWRQPIAVISMIANNMLLDISLESFSVCEAENYAHNIAQQTQNLSETIDDFRNFFKPDKVLSEVSIRNTINSTLSIVHDSLKYNNIEFKTSFETDKKVKAYPRELMQVFVNIINNAKDVLIRNKPNNALINLRIYEDEKYINAEISDNGGGVDVNILPNVFDPYFSTKDEKTGTGLGLYMSKMIIEKHLSGIM